MFVVVVGTGGRVYMVAVVEGLILLVAGLVLVAVVTFVQGKVCRKLKRTAILSDKICVNTSFSSPTGIVSDPLLPFHYPKRVNCLYTIDNGQLNSFIISIDRLFLGSNYDRDRNCNSGWLTASGQTFHLLS